MNSQTNTLEDEFLISHIQSGIHDNIYLKELVSRHSGIYLDMLNSYVRTDALLSNKAELIQEKEYRIYQAALKYNPDKKTKFSTFLGNETKWMCLNMYNRNKRVGEISLDEELLDVYNYKNKETEDNIDRELFSRVIDIVSDFPDDRISKIFNMRYIEGFKNKVMPWKQISEEVNMSIQGCINIHNSTINKLKNRLKKEHP